MIKRNRLFCLYMALALLLLPLHALAEEPFSTSPAKTAESGSAEEESPVPGLSGMEEPPKEEISLRPEPKEEEPIIRVTVPNSGRVLLNPYRLKTALDGKASTEQVLSRTYRMKNESEIPVTVWAQAVGIVPPGSEAVFTLEPPRSDSEEKEAFLFAEFQPADEEEWLGTYSKERNQLLISEEKGNKKPVLTLPAKSEGIYRLFGSTSVPSSRMWTEQDTVNVTIAFSFTTADWWAEPENPNPAIEAISPAASEEDVSSSQTEMVEN